MDNNAKNERKDKYKCSVEYTLSFIGGKWKTIILWHLGVEGTHRYGELKKKLNGINHKMLSQQLKELAEDGLINRVEYSQIPPKVEYSMTKKGMEFMEILKFMHKWGNEN
ncbi:MAG: winged helix-turn-helix transcriptional regulator [Cetobacterium sp.]|uniref:winged helix-turn-helix transcriptional regulator n=1 Tax=Cetobacterium sp. TaxID=2071632 RepID=UPI003F3C40B8